MNPTRNRQRGKNTERALARRLGGRRIGVLEGEDINHPLLSIEAKSRQRFIGEGFMAQAKRHSNGKIPAVIVHVHHKPHDQNLVMMELKDFQDLFGKVSSPEAGGADGD